MEDADAPQADQEEEAPDLSGLRWQSRDALPMGVTFYGTVRGSSHRLESRKLAGVPLRFALAQEIEFADQASLMTALLEASPLYHGPERTLLATGANPCRLVGECPFFSDKEGEAPLAFFRKTSRDAFEVEVPWHARFSQWKSGPPIL